MPERTLKASILVSGEVGAKMRSSLAGATRDTNLFRAALDRLQRTNVTAGRLETGMTALRAHRQQLKAAQTELAALQARMTAAVQPRPGTIGPDRPTKQLQADFEKARQSSERLKKAIQTQAETLKKDRAQLLAAGVNVHQLASEHVRLQGELDKTRARMERLGKLQSAMSAAGSAFSKLRSDLTRIGIAAASVGASGYGIFRFAKDSSEFSFSAYRMARSLGIGTTALMQMHYAGIKSDVTVQDLDQAMLRMVRTTLLARTGLSIYGRAFQRLGIDALSYSKSSVFEQMRILSERFKDLHDPEERGQIGMLLFGRYAGANIADMLAKGPAAWQAMLKEGITSGYAPNGPEIMAAITAAGRIRDFGARLLGFRSQLGTQLLPVITGALDRLGAWLDAHGTELVGFFKSLSMAAVDALPAIGKVADVTLRVAATVARLFDSMPRWAKSVTVVSALMGGATLVLGEFAVHLVEGALAFKKLGGAAVKMLGSESALGGMFGTLRTGALSLLGPLTAIDWPILAIGAAIAVAGVLIYKYWRPLAAFFKGFGQGIAEALGPLWPPLHELLALAGKVFSTVFGWLKPVDTSAAALDRWAAAGRRVGNALGLILLPLREMVWLMNQAAALTGFGSTAPGVGGAAATKAPAGPGKSNKIAWVIREPFLVAAALSSLFRHAGQLGNSRPIQPVAPSSTGSDTMDTAAADAQRFGAQAPGVRMQSAAAGGKPLTVSFNAPITIHAAPGMNVADLAREVARQLKAQQDALNRTLLTQGYAYS
jgi:predicted  nucleic acid-binding Zn-ribbon protein